MNRMGEIIKEKREALELSQDQLGQRLDPPVNRAAVNKWEKGTVENIKRCHIEQMARIFGITPCELLAFEPINPDPDKQRICDLIQKCYGQDAQKVVRMYLDMNDAGRKLAFDLIANLHSNPANIQRDKEKEKRAAV